MKVDEYNENFMVAVKTYWNQPVTIKKCYQLYWYRYNYDMYLSIKEKEKYVIELLKQGKTYREIAHEAKVSPREISRIRKKVNGEMEEKERKKIVLSKTAQALQLFRRGKNSTEVAIKLDLSPQEAQTASMVIEEMG